MSENFDYLYYRKHVEYETGALFVHTCPICARVRCLYACTVCTRTLFVRVHYLCTRALFVHAFVYYQEQVKNYVF